jgi:ribosomal protein S18 acetylase RimI-like enzyme
MDDRISQMTVADFEEVASVWEEAELWPHVGEDRDWFERALARNPDSALVWRQEGKIVGTVIGAWDGLRGWIYHLAVLKAHRNRGIGGELLGAAEDRLWRLGVRQINLMVYEENDFAKAFYLRRGYEHSPAKVLRKRRSGADRQNAASG